MERCVWLDCNFRYRVRIRNRDAQYISGTMELFTWVCAGALELMNIYIPTTVRW